MQLFPVEQADRTLPLVRRIVDEAEHALARAARTVVR